MSVVLVSPSVAEAAHTAPDPLPFATDIRLPRLLHAVIARPPVSGARLANFDATVALDTKGVIGVAELPPTAGPALVRLGGVAVLARDGWTALKGRDALQLSWTDAVDHAADRDQEYFVPETAEPLMERPSAIAQVGADACRAWACLREPERARLALAAWLGLPAEAVVLHAAAPACGPLRFANPAYLFEAARLSRAFGGAPVSLVWTRADDIPSCARAAGA